MSKPLVRRIDTLDGGHYYVDDKDRPISGVTTVLKCLPKGALEKWALRKAVSLALDGEEAWTKAKYDPNRNGNLIDWLTGAGDREAFKAADIGTTAHTFAEAHMLGQNPDLEALIKPAQKHAKCYLNFVADYQPEPILIEKTVTYIDSKSNRPLYCGSLDLIARLTWNDDRDSTRLPNDWVDGEVWNCDYKASASQPRPSHSLQLAAYRHATHWIDEDGSLQEMVPVDHSAVILLNGGKGENGYRMFRLDTSKIVFHVFKCLLTISNFVPIEQRAILNAM